MPVLAYYYMWFTSGSWTHAKTDQPALASNQHRSGDHRQQVTLAKESGVEPSSSPGRAPHRSTWPFGTGRRVPHQGLKLSDLRGSDASQPDPTQRSRRSHVVRNPVRLRSGIRSFASRRRMVGQLAFSDTDIAPVRSQIAHPQDPAARVRKALRPTRHELLS